MAYEASSCGFVLRDEAEGRGLHCEVLAPTKMENPSSSENIRMTTAMPRMCWRSCARTCWRGNRLPTVWIPDLQIRDDRELVRARVELVEKQTRLKAQI